MDRGFGSTFRGSGFGGGSGGPNRQISDRRYDDFYSDSSSRQGNRNRNSGDWGGSNRDRGFFNQSQGGGPVAGRDRGSGNVSGQMLAALQQQQSLLNAFMTSQQSRGILPSPRGNSYRQGGKQGGRYGGRPGDKRKQEMAPSGFQSKRNRRPALAPSRPATSRPTERRSQTSSSSSKSKSSSQEKSKPRSTSPSKKVQEVDEVPDIPDDEVEIPESLMNSVEKLRQRKDVQRNVADEDIQKLLVFCFDGKGYQCLTCGLLLIKESAFEHHLDGKSHVMKVIDARSAKKYQPTRDILDIDLTPDDWFEKSAQAKEIILKQAKMFMKAQRDIKQREIDNYNKNPANFFTVSMETRKAAVRSASTVTIKSIVETSMEVKDFASDRFFGCEFIKAISGFDCRLCGLHIKDSEGVIPHIESRLHKNNYQQHLKKTPGYEKVQKEQNSELSEALKDYEDSFILLTESPQAANQTFLASMDSMLTRVPKLFKPDPAIVAAQKKEEAKEEKDAPMEKKDDDDEKADEKSETHEEEEDNAVNADEENEGEGEGEGDTAEEGEEEEMKEGVDQEEETEDKQDNEDGEEEVQDEEMHEEEAEVKEESLGDDDTEQQNEESENYDPYDPANATPEEHDTKQEEISIQEEPSVNGDEEEEEEPKIHEPPVVPTQPKKSILKKTPTRTPRGGFARRGRGRGKSTPSPRSRGARKAKEAQVAPEAGEQREESNDGNFMGAFEVVDEVEED